MKTFCIDFDGYIFIRLTLIFKVGPLGAVVRNERNWCEQVGTLFTR